jgi:hypothetical protein
VTVGITPGMRTPRRIATAALGLLCLGGGPLLPVTTAGAVPPVPADRAQPWPAATTLDTSVDIENPQVLARYASSDSGSANRAVWVSRGLGSSAVHLAEGPPLSAGSVTNLSAGVTRIGAFDTGAGLMSWYDVGRGVLQVVGIGVSGGLGTSFGVLFGPSPVPGTELMGNPVELTVADGGEGTRAAVVWTYRQPDGQFRTYLVLVTVDAINERFTFGPPQAVLGPLPSIDQVRAYWVGTRLLVAYRTTQGGSQSLRLRTGTMTDGITWTDDQPFCESTVTPAGPGCADPAFAYSGQTQLLYRQVGTDGVPALTSRVLAPGLGAPTVLGPAPAPFAVHDRVTEPRPRGRAVTTRLAVATADDHGVRVWRADQDGFFAPAEQVSTGPATGIAVGARRGDDLVLWRQGSSVVTTRGRGDRWSSPVLVSGTDTVVDAGLSRAGSLPVVWYVDTVPQGERLRTSFIDDEGPNTIWWGIRRAKHHPRMLRLGFHSDDPSGIRISTVQVRFGPPGDLGPWGVFDRRTHKGPLQVDRTLTLKGRPGIRYCARARAVDTLGNVGPWGRKSSDDGAYFTKDCITVRP